MNLVVSYESACVSNADADAYARAMLNDAGGIALVLTGAPLAG